MPFLSPNQHCQSTEGKSVSFHGLAHPKLTLGLTTLSMTTKGAWLPLGMVAMPLVSPVMPVLQMKASITVSKQMVLFCYSMLNK